VQESCPNAGQKIVDGKSTSTPEIFHGLAEHPKSKKIEKNVRESGMHKHVSDYLPDIKVATANRI